MLSVGRQRGTWRECKVGVHRWWRRPRETPLGNLRLKGKGEPVESFEQAVTSQVQRLGSGVGEGVQEGQSHMKVQTQVTGKRRGSHRWGLGHGVRSKSGETLSLSADWGLPAGGDAAGR